MVRHNERICCSFCMFTLLLIKFLMHVSRAIHRNAEPDLLMFRDSMHLVLQNAWNRGNIKEYVRKYHRLETSEKLAVIFNICESISWHVKWRNQRFFMWSDACAHDAEPQPKSFWCSSVSSSGTVYSHTCFFVSSCEDSLQRWTQQHKHFQILTPVSSLNELEVKTYSQ